MQWLNILLSTFSLIIGGIVISLNMPYVSLGHSPNGFKMQLCLACIAILIIPYQYFFLKKKRDQGIFFFILGVWFFGFSLSIFINSFHGLRFAQEYPINGEIQIAHITTDGQCQSSIKTETLPFSVASSSTLIILCPYRTNFSTLKYQVTHANIPLNWQEFMKNNNPSHRKMVFAGEK